MKSLRSFSGREHFPPAVTEGAKLCPIRDTSRNPTDRYRLDGSYAAATHQLHSKIRLSFTRRHLYGCAIAIAAAAAFGGADTAFAQSIRQPSDVADFPFHIGPLGVEPRVRVSTGVDNNIMNDPIATRIPLGRVARGPKEDWVTTITPQARAALRFGRLQFEGQGVLSSEQYRTYNTESSFNVTSNAAVGISLNRLLPFAEYSFVHSKERQGIEIDTRPLRKQYSTTAGIDVRITSKMTLGVSASRGINRYDAEEEFRGTNLSQTLNRDVEAAKVSVRQPLSALTTLEVAADWIRDSFPGSPARDAESFRLGSGLAFKPTALVSGGFNVGFLRFKPIDPSIEEFQGLVATADLAYTLLGVTRFGVLVDRYVTYSYDPANPYYVVNGGTLSITQRAGERWSVWGTAGRYQMEYLPTAAAIGPSTPVDTPTLDALLRPPTDVSDLFVAGITRLFTRGTDLAMSAERFFRHSPLPSRDHQGTRIRVTLAHRF